MRNITKQFSITISKMTIAIILSVLTVACTRDRANSNPNPNPSSNNGCTEPIWQNGTVVFQSNGNIEYVPSSTSMECVENGTTTTQSCTAELQYYSIYDVPGIYVGICDTPGSSCFNSICNLPNVPTGAAMDLTITFIESCRLLYPNGATFTIDSSRQETNVNVMCP